ncbi:MAG TPA: NADH-quinone oxidoreductase subunit G [Deltaproteobacteria bacterium]|nr:MAG: NADH-quinone oxidoreductase subunit G [Deltaproteobacteria bacterium GWA2_55_82]OGQ65124.1 MAG: NADH-quinone oxidoreductase subunit G [Deltaproteobacteria bacterium RIFCSPLOWO2_02_FULL_55_12]OIJ74749.1 MAG: NADH-quinone oxidoreductase subunit G [Deltaproteobacteria bacterium GWC2_55_46]HBG45675.1 NADH-quinone oxidoreductase subunit G [Deltaproteobacteria bacterium]HCY12132.1 NADH-quinone oxidoreductase subunit G [Deltaproteobacteria bacterium]
MGKIYIENKAYEVNNGQNLLHACLSLGLDLPYFCWHPAMHSVGACRQCAVKQFKDESDTKGRIVMACMTPAASGARISIDDPEAKAFRANVIEWMMCSHPHDCPVCDEGGECHLQDMTLMTGHVSRSYRFRKRTYRNQYLGPFLNHEMNRCIQCYRCVRFYRDYAGGTDLNVFSSHDNVYFGRHEDGVLENEFSGNLAEVCPTGVFTDKTFKRHFTRKWDLQSAPSVCVHCGVGCNTIPGERYNELRRISNRYNGEVNRYFLCDRGRYGYEFVNGHRRLREPRQRGDGDDKRLTAKEAVIAAARLISSGKGAAGIGSPRASLEANFALRSLVGPDNFYMGVSGRDLRAITLASENLLNGPARSPSLREIEGSDAVLLIGEDVTNTAPVLALALRQAARNGPVTEASKLRIPFWDDGAVRTATQGMKGSFYLLAPYATKLDDIAKERYCASPDGMARLGFAIAHEIDKALPGVDDLPEDERELAGRIADGLMKAERPVVVAGMSLGSEPIINAAARVAWALCKAGKEAGLHYSFPECNSLGAAMLERKSLDEAFIAAGKGKHEIAIILENDLSRRLGPGYLEAIKSFRQIIVLDSIVTPASTAAGLLLPSASFAQSDGTLVNSEGRAQRHFKVFTAEAPVMESWRWISDIKKKLGIFGWGTINDITRELAKELPAFERLPDRWVGISGMKIARQTHRASGRTAVTAERTVFEPKPPEDPDAPFLFSMEGFHGQPPSPFIPRFWAPGWNSIQSVNKFQSEVGRALRGGDPGLRLIEPGHSLKEPSSLIIPPAFKRRKGEWLLVPIYHIFGSEEMSVLSPSVATLVPDPYLGLGAREAAIIGVRAGEELSVKVSGAVLRLPVRIISRLPEGLAGLPVLPDLPVLPLPGWCVLSKVKLSAA